MTECERLYDIQKRLYDSQLRLLRVETKLDKLLAASVDSAEVAALTEELKQAADELEKTVAKPEA